MSDKINGCTVGLREDGTYILNDCSCEKINRRVSEINASLKTAKELLDLYTDEQLKLRSVVKGNNGNAKDLTENQLKKVKRQIAEHRALLNGIHTYIKVLKREKAKLQIAYPKNMKPKRSKLEKMQNTYTRLCEYCKNCSVGTSKDICYDCEYYARKRVILEKLKKAIDKEISKTDKK